MGKLHPRISKVAFPRKEAHLFAASEVPGCAAAHRWALFSLQTAINRGTLHWSWRSVQGVTSHA